MATYRAPSSIDPNNAVPVKDLLSSFTAFQNKVLKRFPEPPSRSATAKSAGMPVTNGVKKGWGVQYTKKGIPAYWRLRRKLEGVWDELTGMQMLAQYVKIVAPVAAAPMKAAPKKRRKRRSS